MKSNVVKVLVFGFFVLCQTEINCTPSSEDTVVGGVQAEDDIQTDGNITVFENAEVGGSDEDCSGTECPGNVQHGRKHRKRINQVSKAGWPPSTGGTKSYEAYTILNNFLEAYVFCFNDGGRLAIINNEEEHEMVLAAILKTNKYNNQFWTSGTDLGQEGRWIWLPTIERFNRSINYFHENQPDNWANLEHCLEYWEHGNKGYKWNDRNCQEKHYFVCEYYDYTQSLPSNCV